MRGKRRRESRPALLPTQREVIRDVMLAGKKFGAWLTLKEIARLTGYGEASISAQLRHLRKPQYGRFVLRKRCREELNGRDGWRGPVWEYMLSRSRDSRLQRRRNFTTRKLARRGAPRQSKPARRAR